MTEQELAALIKDLELSWDEDLCPSSCFCHESVGPLLAEVRRLRDLIPWCPRGEGEHLLDDTFSGWCSTCGDTVT